MISPPPIENSSDHEQAEALDLIDGNGRRHGEFLPAHDGFNQSRPVMTERLLDHRSDLIRRFGSEPKDAGSVGQYSSNLVGDCQSLGAGPAPGPLGSSFRGKTGAAVNAADAAAARV